MATTQAGQVTVPAARAGFPARVRGWLRAAGALPARFSRTSAAKAAGAPISRPERVLSTDRDVQGSLIAATVAAIYYQDAAAPGRTWSRLGWEEVSRVFWDDRRRVLTLTGVGAGGIWRKDLVLASRTALVELARERVTSTLLASTEVRDRDRVYAWVTARRRPATGTVVWMVLLNETGSTGDPAIPARVEAAIATLQAQTGIPGETTASPGWPPEGRRLPAAAAVGPADLRRPREHYPGDFGHVRDAAS